MTFVGGAFAVAPLAALLALAVCVAVTLAARSFAYGARAGVFGFVPLQLALDGPERLAATGGLMCIIGVFFLARRRPARATSGRAAAPTR
jgi:glycerol-3-phosphate acyltransferase PlsY